MSFKDGEKKCAVCGAYLFKEDDVVYCPDCGAPHHRDCYNALGRCGLHNLHGTENQYDLVQKRKQQDLEKEQQEESLKTSSSNGTVSCRMCSREYFAEERRCPSCGAPNVEKMGGGFARFDFLGGVPANTDLGDNVTADEAKRFVAANTQRYIPKFAAMTVGKRVFWNWIAFLFPCGWLMSRKMYKGGALVGTVQIALSLLTVPFGLAINNIDMSSAKNYLEMASLIAENIPKIGMTLYLVALAAVFFDLVLRIITALMGDYFYKNYTISSVSQIKKESDDIELDYRKAGGVNLFMMLLGVFAVEYLPQIIAMFLV